MDKKFDINELVEQLNNLDPNNPGVWPASVKIVMYILIFVAVVVGGYFFYISDKNTQLGAVSRKEANLLKSFEDKAFQAMNIDQYRRQLAEMEQAFDALLKQLPKDAEVPDLLDDLSTTAEGSGLSSDGLSLVSELKHPFYIEQPIDVVVSGEFHSLGSFVSGVASLHRIVTLHDYNIRKSGDGLTMQITAKTYRYSGGQE